MAMVRLKFLVFAFLVILLGLVHLPILSGPLRERAVAGATSQTAAGASEVARSVEARRAEVQALALKLAATPDVVSAVAALQPARTSAPRNSIDRGTADESASNPLPLTAARFSAVRTAARAVLPKAWTNVVVAVVAQDAQFHAVGATGKPSSDTAKLDVAAVAKAGTTTVAEAFGVLHVFASVPLLWNGDLRPQPVATLVVGAPLVDQGMLQAAVEASGVAALALVKGGAVVVGAGPEQALAEASLAQVQANTSGVVLRRGQLQPFLFGLVKLPILTHGDFMGGQAPLMVGSRRALEGTPLESTPLEVLAVADTGAVLGALAVYQQDALIGLMLLLAVTLVWTGLIGATRSGDESHDSADTLSLSSAMAADSYRQPQYDASAEDAFAMPPPAPAPEADPFETAAPPPASMADPFETAAPPPASMADPFSMSPPAQAPTGDPFALQSPTANPISAPAAEPLSAADPFGAGDVFPFPAPPPAPSPMPFATAAAMPFEAEVSAFTPPSDVLSPASPRRGAFAFEDQPTAAYSLHQAADPFALAAAQESDSPETTRVAAIPRELLQASTRPQTTEAIPMPAARFAPPPPAAIPLPGLGNSAVALSEEQHFQEVFREFLTTRERCGELADGLTYDKFVQKLRKNKEQLVQKYACKTVRFHVYVKEGKAALKATPVKD
jgi:hypothetical protein